jgi:uncharacterized protein with PIN domain
MKDELFNELVTSLEQAIEIKNSRQDRKEEAILLTLGSNAKYPNERCHWCNQDITETDVTVSLSVLDEKKGVIFERPNIEYPYCPICGRKVEW